MQEFQFLLHEPSARALELKLSGEIDMGTVGPLRDAVAAATASGDYDAVVFDLTEVGFMDSSALHLLTEAHRAMTAAGGRMTVVCPAANMRKIFELTGLDRVFSIVTDGGQQVAVAA